MSTIFCSMSVLAVRPARLKRFVSSAVGFTFPHTKAWFSLGRWGKLINVAALIYGGLMIINIALWADTGLFGDYGTDGRLYWNPMINTFIKPFGQELSWMPAWPLFETLIGLILFVGAIYYLAVVRRQAPDVEGTATGLEKVIG